MDSVPTQADVVVIGGGIVGSATAYNLAKRGASVVLVEKGDIAGEQSGRNWGFVRQQGRDPREIPLMIECGRIADIDRRRFQLQPKRFDPRGIRAC